MRPLRVGLRPARGLPNPPSRTHFSLTSFGTLIRFWTLVALLAAVWLVIAVVGSVATLGDPAFIFMAALGAAVGGGRVLLLAVMVISVLKALAVMWARIGAHPVAGLTSGQADERPG